MDKASRKTEDTARRARKAAKESEQAWANVGNLIKGAFAGITVVGIFSKFATESRNAQNEQAQLAAVLKSTGEAAGFTQGKLNDMATELANSSIFGEGDINRAQTRLLSYTGIVGEQFPEAMQSVIDMASRMGMTVEQSAETIGRALDIPSQGLTALSKQGFRFTEDQKKLVEQLEATGRVGEAQGIILAALESSYGGAALAARDTFGGAIIALQNQLNSLMTGSDGSLDGAAKSINELTKELGSEETKEAFATFTSALADIVSLVARAAPLVRDLAAGANAIGGLADKIAGDLTPLDELELKIKGIDRALEEGWFNKLTGFSRLFTSPEELRAMKADLEAQRDALLALNSADPEPSNKPKTGTRNSSRLGGGLTIQPLVPKLTEEEKANLAFIKEAWSFVEKYESEANDAAQALILSNHEAAESYRDMLDPTREITREMEKIDKLVEAGRLSPDEAEAIKVARLKDAYTHLGDEIKEMDEFTKNFAENTQRMLGDGLVDTMNGSFDDIGKNFAKMLQRMVADAMAANIARSMFGDKVKGGTGDGWLGTTAKWVGNLLSFDGGGSTGSGPRSGGLDGKGGFMAMLHPNETVLDHTKGQGMGASIHYAPVIHIDSRADRQQVMQEVNRAVSNGNAQLVEKLQRAGRI